MSIISSHIVQIVEPVVLVGRDGSILEANASAAAMLATGHASLSGVPVDSVFSLRHATALSGERDLIGLALRGEFSGALPPGCLLVSGERTSMVDGSISPLKQGDTLEAVLVMMRSLTVFQKRAMASVRASESRWRALVEYSGAFIYLKDADRRYVYANRAFLTLIGDADVDRLAGRSDHELLPPLAAELVRTRDLEVLRTGQPATTEDEFVIDEQKRNFFSTRFLLPDQADARVLCCVSTDVTGLRDVENQLRRHEQDLAHFSRISTAGEMASALAHELSQPLGATLSYVQGALQWLRNGGEQERVHRSLAGAEAQILRASGVIGRLKQFLQNRQPALAPLDLNEVAERSLFLIKTELAHTQVRAEVVPAPAPLWVNADAIQLEQVVINLARNAIQAMANIDPAERQLDIILEADAAAAWLRVRDHGHGVPGGASAQLFEPFFTTRADGMGLGLKISQKIVRSLGGELVFQNRVPRGAEFAVRLPLRPDGPPG